MIVHLVLFNPKPDISAERRAQFTAAIQQTCREIPSVRRAIVGRRTEIDAGYQRSFGEKTYYYVASMEFDDRKGLIDYLKHPSHKVLGRMFWDLCESTVVLEVDGVDAREEEIAKILV